MTQNTVLVGEELQNSVVFGNAEKLTIIAGPCAIENLDHALMVASSLKKIADEVGFQLVYKSSFDKANRSSLKSYRGVGMEKGLETLKAVRDQLSIPVLTDVHAPEQCQAVADVVDILQIPAFLSRQTDLIVAAAQTGKALHVKKGQFMAPWDMKNVVDKVQEAGNNKLILCDRGTSFGYNTLISDMRGLPIMRATGCPVIFDATHSVQQPGGAGTTSSGQRQFVPTLARAAVAVGVAGVFIETHEEPGRAPSDGPNMIPLAEFKQLATVLMAFDSLAKTYPENPTI